MGWLYGTSLAVSIAGLVTLDRRFSLAFWVRPRRTALVLAAAVVAFLIWDVCGISLGIFFRGAGPYQSGLQITDELPVEEVAFLTLLSYLTLLVFAAAQRRAVGRGDR